MHLPSLPPPSHLHPLSTSPTLSPLRRDPKAKKKPAKKGKKAADEESDEEAEEEEEPAPAAEEAEGSKAPAYASKSGKHKGSNAGLKAYVIAQAGCRGRGGRDMSPYIVWDVSICVGSVPSGS